MIQMLLQRSHSKNHLLRRRESLNCYIHKQKQQFFDPSYNLLCTCEKLKNDAKHRFIIK